MTNCSYLLLPMKVLCILSMLCLWWLPTGLTYPLMILWVLWWLNWLVIGFFWWHVYDWSLLSFFLSSIGLPIKFPIAYPFHPSKWLCHPNLGFLFLTPLMRFFHNMNVLRCLGGQESHSQFWRWWLFNYRLTFTLNFPILNFLDWHGTKGFAS
jgi:hypothetical protein